MLILFAVCRYYFLWNKQSFQLYEHLLDADDSKVPSNSSSPPSAVRGAVSTRGLQKLSKNTSSSLLTAVQGGLCTLYVQCQGTPELPPFINVVEEVNGETDEYSAYNMSKIE